MSDLSHSGRWVSNTRRSQDFALTLIHLDWGHHKSAASSHSTVPIACVASGKIEEKGMGYPLSFSLAPTSPTTTPFEGCEGKKLLIVYDISVFSSVYK